MGCWHQGQYSPSSDDQPKPGRCALCVSSAAAVDACRRLRSKCFDALFDWRYGIYTRGCVYSPVGRGVSQDACYYQPTRYRLVWQLLRRLDLGEDDVFVDFGCGKGRVVCLAARARIRKAVGVELMPDLAVVARSNANRIRKRSPVEIVTTDATLFDPLEGTVFFFNNPFGEKTLKSVIRNIAGSLMAAPRTVRIAYVTPHFRRVLDEQDWLSCEWDAAPGLGIWRGSAPRKLIPRCPETHRHLPKG